MQRASEGVERDRQENILQHVKSTVGYRAGGHFEDAGEESERKRKGSREVAMLLELEMSYQ